MRSTESRLPKKAFVVVIVVVIFKQNKEYPTPISRDGPIAFL